jgi:hypothetical protein
VDVLLFRGTGLARRPSFFCLTLHKLLEEIFERDFSSLPKGLLKLFSPPPLVKIQSIGIQLDHIPVSDKSCTDCKASNALEMFMGMGSENTPI